MVIANDQLEIFRQPDHTQLVLQMTGHFFPKTMVKGATKFSKTNGSLAVWKAEFRNNTNCLGYYIII